MMFFLKLSLLNLLRRYGRTTLSMVSVIVGVLVIILGRGTIDGLRESIIRGQIDAMTGHVTALPADYPTAGLSHPLENLLTLDDATTEWLNTNTVGWTQRLLFAPRVVSGMDAVRVRAIGYCPETDTRVFPRGDWNVQGTIPETDSDGILLTRGIARTLSLNKGDSVIVETRTHAGALNALQVPVAGTVSTGNPAIDGLVVFVPMPLAESLVRPNGQFSHLSLLLNRRADADNAAAQLQSLLGNTARTTTWEIEAAPGLEAQDIRQTFLDIIAMALLIMAAAGIANTVLMAAYERIREIGTLRALGLTRRGVMGLFVTEGFVMGLIGSIIGAAAGAWMTWKYSIQGIDMTSFVEQVGASDMMQDLPFSTMLYMNFSVSIIVIAIIVGVTVATVSSFYPAMVASSRNPADATRG